jgi:UDP-N-acetylglucosamine:LPS N-acetylglucosamine transferase
VQRIEFVYFEAGGGHRSAANALKAVIERQDRGWDVRLMNLQEVLDPLDVFRKLTGIRMEDVYNLFLKKGWTLGSPQMLVAMHAIIRLYHGSQVRLLKQYWEQARPDMVVSLVPNFNRAMFESLRAVSPATPYVTILTDFADYPPHFWMERQEQYLICGTQKAVEQAHALGYPENRVFATSGMILRPKFYDPVTGDRREERRKLGLDPDLPTGLVLFGGEGSHWMLKIPPMVAAAGLKLQLISICGRNAALKSRLEALRPGFPMRVEGFTSEIPYFMDLSDFFIGKPGPGSISEALAMKLPVLVERNAWTLPQERYNADWVHEQQVGVVLDSFREIAAGLKELLEPANFARFRANAAAVTNRAVFEIPEILDGVLRPGNPVSQ